MTLKEQIEAVRQRLERAYGEQIRAVPYANHVEFCGNGSFWCAHYYNMPRQHSPQEGLPIWPGREGVYPQHLVDLENTHVLRIRRSTEHSVLLTCHDGTEIELWPEIRRMSRVHCAVRRKLYRLGYVSAGTTMNGAWLCRSERIKQGSTTLTSDEHSHLIAQENRAMYEGWHPFLTTEAATAPGHDLDVFFFKKPDPKWCTFTMSHWTKPFTITPGRISMSSQHGKSFEQAADRLENKLRETHLVTEAIARAVGCPYDLVEKSIGELVAACTSAEVKTGDRPDASALPFRGWHAYPAILCPEDDCCGILAEAPCGALICAVCGMTAQESDAIAVYGDRPLEAAPCQDCKGTGVYVGLFETSPCKTCQSC